VEIFNGPDLPAHLKNSKQRLLENNWFILTKKSFPADASFMHYKRVKRLPPFFLL
jgi:hypothetical protein